MNGKHLEVREIIDFLDVSDLMSVFLKVSVVMHTLKFIVNYKNVGIIDRLLKNILYFKLFQGLRSRGTAFYGTKRDHMERPQTIESIKGAKMSKGKCPHDIKLVLCRIDLF